VPPFVNPPVPLMLPLNELVLLSAVVNVAEPKLTLPAPAIEPIVSAKLFKLNVAEPETTTSLESGMTPAAPNCNVPAVIFVPAP